MIGQPARKTSAALLVAVLGGCDPAAPAVPFLGAFFPAWLLAALVGILTAIIVRIVFIQISLDDVLPARLVVYVAVATLAGLVFSHLAFGR